MCLVCCQRANATNHNTTQEQDAGSPLWTDSTHILPLPCIIPPTLHPPTFPLLSLFLPIVMWLAYFAFCSSPAQASTEHGQSLRRFFVCWLFPALLNSQRANAVTTTTHTQVYSVRSGSAVSWLHFLPAVASVASPRENPQPGTTHTAKNTAD